MLLVFVGLWLSTELYQEYIQGFYDLYAVDVSCEGDNAIASVVETAEVALRSSVYLLMAEVEYRGERDTTIVLYCDEATKKLLEECYWYEGGNSHSLLVGRTQIVYRSFSDMDAEMLIKEAYQGYLCGSEENITKFYKEISDDVDAELFEEPQGSKEEVLVRIAFVWICVIAIISLLIYYESVVNRKELYVRLSVGESMTRRLIQNVVLDVAIFALETAIVCAMAEHLFIRTSFVAFAWLTVLALGAVSAGINRLVAGGSFRYALSNIKVARKALPLTYAFLVAFITLLLLLFSTNVALFERYFELNSQKEFYEERAGYLQVQFIPQGDDEFIEDVCGQEFYQRYYEEYRISEANVIAETGTFELYRVNSNMRTYLEEKLNVTIAPNEEEILCFYPDTHTELQAKSQFEMCFERVGQDDTESPVKYICYKSDVYLVDQDDDEYCLVKNPLIGYDPRSDYKGEEIDFRLSFFLGAFYIKCSEEQVRAFAEEHGARYIVADVYDGYYSVYRPIAVLAFVTACFFAVLFVVVFVFIGTVVRLEYEANRMELLIQKTMGVSLWDRFWKLYLGSEITMLIGIIISMIVCGVIGWGNLIVILLGGLGFMLIVALYITWICVRADNENIQRVLKCG